MQIIIKPMRTIAKTLPKIIPKKAAELIPVEQKLLSLIQTLLSKQQPELQ